MEPDHEYLVKAMMGFAQKVRQSWAIRLGGVPGGERLTERDWMLLEWLNERDEAPFSEAVEHVSGKISGTGGSQAAITAAIGRMSRGLGLLKTKRTKEDERKKIVSITQKGRKLIEQRNAIRWNMYERIIQCWQPLSKIDCERMTKLFQKGLTNAKNVFGNDA